MNSAEISAKLCELYTAAEAAIQNGESVALRAHHDYSSTPLKERPEAGFSIWIPPADDGAYAGLSIVPAEHGVTSYGEAGVKRSDREYHLFSWPSIEVRDSGFVVDNHHIDSANEAVRRLIRGLRERSEAARRG